MNSLNTGPQQALLQAQMQVRKTGPDPKMNLILEKELHEIQRIWRIERGDWQNSVYQIYEKITGEALSQMPEDLGSFGKVEQEILQKVCLQHNVPQLLVSKLLNAEFESQGMTRHSKIYGKLNKILSEEWREDHDEIFKDLKQRKHDQELGK